MDNNVNSGSKKSFDAPNQRVEEELIEVNKNLALLIEKIDGRKKRDVWDRFQILASFISSVLFAGVGLYFTTVYNHREADRQEKLQSAQLAMAEREEKRDSLMKHSQLRIEELNAITNITPFLASKDENIRRYAMFALQSLFKKEDIAVSLANKSYENNNLKKLSLNDTIRSKLLSKTNGSVLLSYALMVIEQDVPLEEKKVAVKNLKDAVINPQATQKVQEEAAKYLSMIAGSEKVPTDIRETALDYLKDIRRIQRSSIISEIEREKVERNVDELILHHTWKPDIKTYRGEKTIQNIAQVMVNDRGYSRAAWHYIVSPDGLVWTGRPLNMIPASIMTHNNGTISIEIILNGDEELPTDEQKKSLGILLSALCKRFNIDPKYNFSENRGFHSDYPIMGKVKSCPGKLIKKDMVLSWINSYGR
ncbi:peptidoglycan recognition family protein [Paraflavisolibacter sp. H34]|uniref:peptidoglycan recognition protein family protein n=1 Tax=Huijunlia imazamoxiresistens TaxID=3127457 RepID=UPI003016F298